MTIRNLAVALVAGSAILASATPAFAKKHATLTAAPVASADHARFSTANFVMLDALVTHDIHTAVMDDIDKDPTMGPKADANFHAVLTQR